ncbi:MAG: NAD-dependent epimerase/dehydratase family protein [Candidatus Baltobacteraceae bacterium]
MEGSDLALLLVTGGAGYVGAHFCGYLEKLAWDYVVLENLSRGHAPFEPPEPLIVGVFGDQDLIAAIVSEYRVDTVVHFATSRK